MNRQKQERLARELKSISDDKDFFANPGYKWNNGNDNIVVWTGSETGFIDGLPIASYYSEFGYHVHPKFTKWLAKNKLSWEWYDPGTIHIFEE